VDEFAEGGLDTATVMPYFKELALYGNADFSKL
jgi:hypothetical protein